jgi:predicted ATPase
VRATRELAVELLAAEPLCIAIDDAHWMDSASWGLTRDVVRQARPGLVLLAMRPVDAPAPECAQLLAEPGAARLDLGSLADADALDLAAERLGAEWLDAPVADLILERAGGNPLFVEEIARALADAGLVSVDRAGTCVVTRGADLRRLALPDTVEGVIASRMDGLTAPVDLTLKVSSVVGPTFLARLVRDVHPVERVAARVDATLETLVARELTQPASATAYSFRHALIRDVAYERLLFGQRRALHRAIGEWHEREHAENLPPVYAALAHHFTQAGDVERACDYLGRASVEAINNGMSREAVELGLAAARLLGVELPRTPGAVRGAIGECLGAIGALMAGRAVESLATLPPATDPARAAAIGTLLQTAPAAFISRQSELFALIGLQAFRLSLESGATPYLPGVLSLYALITRSLEVDPRPAFALSSLAERLAKRDSPALLANAAFVHSWFVHHWLEPIADILPRIPAWADAGFEHGDVTMGCFNVAGYVTLLAAGGAPLDDVIAAGAAGLERIAGRTASAVFHCRHEMQIAKALAGRTVRPCSLTDADTDEERDLAAVRDTDMVNQYAYYLSSKLRLHFYFGEPAAALGYGDQAEPLLDAFAGQQQEAEFVFFHGLALLAHARETGDARALARGEAAVERMRAWAAYAPAVFGGRVAIMEGQLAWARGERELAVERFAEGAADADPHHAALAHELAGRCLGDSEHLRAAIAGYRAWGAAAKVSDVEAALG